VNFKAVIEQVWTSTWRQLKDGAPGAETVFISQSARNHGTVKS